MNYEIKSTLISLNSVVMEFDGKRVLDGVSAEVKDIVRPGVTQGQVVGILGPSGVGKTQLSRILAGLQRPTSGSVTIFTDAKERPVEPGLVGLVPQNYPLLKHRTVLGNLVLAGEMAGRSDPKDRAMDYLQRFDLVDKAKEYPACLSGGQRQRVAIAQQLLCSEHFVILDEPFTGLDPLMKDRTVQLIKQVALMSEETTLFVVAHDIPAVLSIADCLWVLGRDRDATGKVTSGTKIKRVYDLAAMGLAWHEDVLTLPDAVRLLAEVKDLFKTL